MADNLRIGINCYPTFGGSGVVATELGLALSRMGHEVHFISSRLPARLRRSPTADVSFHEVNTYNYALFQHAPYTLTLAAKLAEVAETFELDILHVHYAIPHAVAGYLAREMLAGDVKLVTTLHGTDITLIGNDPSLRKMTQFAIDRSDAVTAVSDWLADETIKEFNPHVPVEVVPNFISLSEFNPELRNDWPGHHYCCEDRPNIVHVSNFRPVKRAIDAVEVFARVHQEHPAHLLMLGDGPDLPRAVQRARELGVLEQVSFLGNREDVAYFLSAADVLLMPSESESFGLGALEAMACGCAVVASNAGGLPEVVRDGVDGWLCDIGDLDTMARHLKELITNAELLNKTKQAAREGAQRFATKLIVPQYLELYQRVLAGGVQHAAG